jgi:hypothetical protein
MTNTSLTLPRLCMSLAYLASILQLALALYARLTHTMMVWLCSTAAAMQSSVLPLIAATHRDPSSSLHTSTPFALKLAPSSTTSSFFAPQQ